jgi:hypothetical protein|tara:strand:- start:31 stop:261 length:231 start_codon:yes stop_codon:yes gene_type:complete
MATKKKTKKDWIGGAVKRPGAFTAKAKKAGMSVQAYANKVLKKGSKATAQTKRQARLAKTFKKMAPKKKKTSKKKK